MTRRVLAPPMDAQLRARIDAALADPRVAAVLVPLAPEGGSRVARAARRLMAAWDARLVHDDTWLAPGARVVTRDGESTCAEAAPRLRDALDRGQRVVALRDAALPMPVPDLDAWVAWWRADGAAWGALARRDPRFAAAGPRSWWTHNVLHAHRRVGEVAQARRRIDAGATGLHLAREAAWTRAFLRGL